MNYFLAKTDPDTYNVDDFMREGETEWDGVHNYQAINVIKTMKPGDTVFVYHSQSDKAIVGLAKVTGEPYENKADSRFSWAVRMKFLKKVSPISLASIKANPSAADFLLVRHSRLSVMPVPEPVATWLLGLVDQEA